MMVTGLQLMIGHLAHYNVGEAHKHYKENVFLRNKEENRVWEKIY